MLCHLPTARWTNEYNMRTSLFAQTSQLRVYCCAASPATCTGVIGTFVVVTNLLIGEKATQETFHATTRSWIDVGGNWFMGLKTHLHVEVATLYMQNHLKQPRVILLVDGTEVSAKAPEGSHRRSVPRWVQGHQPIVLRAS